MCSLARFHALAFSLVLSFSEIPFTLSTYTHSLVTIFRIFIFSLCRQKTTTKLHWALILRKTELFYFSRMSNKITIYLMRCAHVAAQEEYTIHTLHMTSPIIISLCFVVRILNFLQLEIRWHTNDAHKHIHSFTHPAFLAPILSVYKQTHSKCGEKRIDELCVGSCVQKIDSERTGTAWQGNILYLQLSYAMLLIDKNFIMIIVHFTI